MNSVNRSPLRSCKNRVRAAVDGALRHRRQRSATAQVEAIEGRVLLSAYTLSQIGYLGTNATGANPASTSTVVADANGDLFGTTSIGGAEGFGTVFELPNGSNTLTTLASFNGTNGRFPSGLTLDASGNLYGTTAGGGAYGDGTVFEIAKGLNTITTLASFNGASPQGGVTLDGSGSLYGTTTAGGTNNNGTVFEIAQGSSTITTLASFNGINGTEPYTRLALDTSGTLYGTTYSGGANDDGTVFEIANASHTITTVASFDGTNGRVPNVVTLDTSGNLYGTTAYGGANGVGAVFEIVKGSNTITTLGSFDRINGPLSNPGPNGVTLDASGNLYGTTRGVGGYGAGIGIDGTVFRIANGSHTITTVASFDGTNGKFPSAVTLDAAGNLYGTTSGGGAKSDGTVFEIAGGSGGTITTLASFNSLNGTQPYARLTLDASGNLYGTTSFGGANDDGTVFEITRGSDTISILASFDGANGTNPQTAVTPDASGNLYGATQHGGLNGDGTVFEIAKGANTITPLASFDGTNGSLPNDVTLDGAGNLYGTTYSGGADNAGTIFEIAAGSKTINTLFSFNRTDGPYPYAGVTLDTSGNLYGTTQGTGVNNDDGTVFELAKGSAAVTTLASFNGTNPDLPEAGVTLDASGNLYGTKSFGGTNNCGTVFEIVKGSNSITTLASFDGADGAYPRGVTVDASGNLTGTTSGGGASNYGTVFEIVKGASTGTLTTVASFNFANGDGPQGGVTLDASGNFYGTTEYGGNSGFGTVFELSPSIPLSASFQVNDGGVQRSMVTSLTVTFGGPVTIDPGGLVLQTSGGMSVPFQLNTSDNQTYVLSFSGSQFVGGSLADGRYVLSVEPGLMHDGAGETLSNAQSFNFFRLFGDVDGNGIINNLDYLKFKKSYLSMSGDPAYLPLFDYDSNGIINNFDFLQFKKRYLTMI